jgi:hypothetical protein
MRQLVASNLLADFDDDACPAVFLLQEPWLRSLETMRRSHGGQHGPRIGCLSCTLTERISLRDDRGRIRFPVLPPSPQAQQGMSCTKTLPWAAAWQLRARHCYWHCPIATASFFWIGVAPSMLSPGHSVSRSMRSRFRRDAAL